MKSNELKLKSKNISDFVDIFIQKNMQGEEVQLPILCQLSKCIIDIPVRHSNFALIKCIFDLNIWLEYCQKYKRGEMMMVCPGCKKQIISTDYGVDYKLYHALEAFKLFKIQYRRMNPNKYIEQNELFYQASYSNPVYKVKVKNNKKALDFEKVIIPGTYPIFGIQKRHLLQITNQTIQKKKIHDEIAQTIEKLSQYFNRKLYFLSKERSITKLQQLIYPKKNEVRNLFKNSIKLISLGKKSLKNDFIFALKTIQGLANRIKSLLIVYYVYYDVWQEYNLEYNSNPIDILEQQLCIKEFGEGKDHQLYIIGGIYTTDRFKQSSQFLRIQFPSNPYEKKEAQLEILPNLPIEGYNFMGTQYKGKIYVFYGQTRKVINDVIINELLNTTYAFRSNKWEKLDILLENRFDGSFFISQDPIFDKLVIFYGGISHYPDGIPNQLCTQQNRIQIFSCKEENLLGNQQKYFEPEFSKKPEDQYQQKVLCSPLFSCSYYGRNQLILSGENLKKPLNADSKFGKREIYTLDWENGRFKLNEIFSLEPLQQLLTIVKASRQQGSFQPVEDFEGCIAYGNYYTIFHTQSENKSQQKIQSITQLLKIDLTNSQFRIYQYQDNDQSVQKSKKLIEKFEIRENIIL
ncbi:unnamed protein product (macronuclear) [Paramecium tetraurelia]|uniref:Uncharacterized protein n=1 Tax=Paramecium tetraurelia TaxID=5888 RepID=A0DSN1_PARTE|nr:uncharacterized protein GSPATT00019741001 [Paramecium tetraurelia]CAK86048.1 unnamed protein product [Paramecium tetraurelia]|eukprot:XP_001453445.1 hypothetical protein (macronuclear) [Paramecium tetraurelia strain d4-2]